MRFHQTRTVTSPPVSSQKRYLYMFASTCLPFNPVIPLFCYTEGKALRKLDVYVLSRTGSLRRACESIEEKRKPEIKQR